MTTPRDDIAGRLKARLGSGRTVSVGPGLYEDVSEAATQLDALQARVKELEADHALLTDPIAVHINICRGTIAKPSWENIRHLYPRIYDLEASESHALRAEQERDEAYERADGLSDAISHAEDMLSKHIEEFHDFDYEPHQIPQELTQLNGIRHHLLGSLIDEKGEPIRRLAAGPEKDG